MIDEVTAARDDALAKVAAAGSVEELVALRIHGADPEFDPRKVKQRMYRMYRERLDRFLADRGRQRAAERAESAAPA